MSEQENLLFLKEIYTYSKNIEDKTGIPHIAILAQAALESGWGKKRINNNLFGIKYKEGDFGFNNVLTTEYSKDKNKFKDYVKREQIGDKYKFLVYQKFADYKSVEDCLLEHSKLLLTDRYKESLRWKHSPKRYLISVWRSGYATDINYGYKILGATKDGVKYYSIVDSVVSRLKKLKLE